MKYVLTLAVALMFGGGVAFADCNNFSGTCFNGQNGDTTTSVAGSSQASLVDDTLLGVKVGAPYIIGLGSDWYLGPELSVDFNDSYDNDVRFGAFAVVTYRGTLIGQGRA